MGPGARVNRRTHRFRRIVVLALVFVLLALAANMFWGRSDPVLGDAGAPIAIVWTSDSLQPQLAEGARQVEGIGDVATARNGVAWLNSWSAEDAAAQQAPAGFQVPIEVLAVVPEDYARFVPASERELFEGLADGGALLGGSGASLRDIESQGTLGFSKAAIPVEGVVPDDLIASHEVVMSLETASGLGISDLKYILIELERGTTQQEAEQALRGKLPAGARLGMRAPGESQVLRPGGTILAQVEIKKKFGEFSGKPGSGRSITVDPKWIAENTANVNFPLLGSARCHKKVVPQIRGAFQEVIDKDLSALVRRSDFGGCFAPRFLNSDPNSGISHHAWGIAFDFNVSRNPYGVKPTMDPRLVELLEEWGLTWGGRWVVPDGMHFEYLSDPEGS
jgi:hypothetical protein